MANLQEIKLHELISFWLLFVYNPFSPPRPPPYHHITSSPSLSVVVFFCLSLQRQTDFIMAAFQRLRTLSSLAERPTTPTQPWGGVWLWEGRRARRQVPVQWGHMLETVLLSVWAPSCSDWNGHKKWNPDLTNTPPRSPPTTSWCLRLALWHDQSGHGKTLITARVTLNTCTAATNHSTTI